MSDHALAIIGVAITVIAFIAPYRWPKMHKLVSDFGLFIGAALLVIAFEPTWGPYFNPPLPLIEATVPIPPPQTAGLSKDQQEIGKLKAMLAATQTELEKTKDLLAISDAVQGWGIMNPNTFYMAVDASKFSKYKNKLKLMMIVRIPYSNVDRMSDTRIVKSQFYSVSNAVVTLTREGLSGLQTSPQMSAVEFDLVGFPQGFANPEKITSLNDLEGLGATIIAVKASTLAEARTASSGAATCPRG